MPIPEYMLYQYAALPAFGRQANTMNGKPHKAILIEAVQDWPRRWATATHSRSCKKQDRLVLASPRACADLWLLSKEPPGVGAEFALELV